MLCSPAWSVTVWPRFHAKLVQVWRELAEYFFVFVAKSEVTLAISEHSGCINTGICLERGSSIYLSCQRLLKDCTEHRNLHFVILPSLLAGRCSIKRTHTRLREARLSYLLWSRSLGASFGFAPGAESDSVRVNVERVIMSSLCGVQLDRQSHFLSLTRTDCSEGFLMSQRKKKKRSHSLPNLCNWPWEQLHLSHQHHSQPQLF